MDTGEPIPVDVILVGVIIAFWVCVRKAFKVIVAAEPTGFWPVISLGVPEIPGKLQAESTMASEMASDRSLNVFNFVLMITMKIKFGAVRFI